MASAALSNTPFDPSANFVDPPSYVDDTKVYTFSHITNMEGKKVLWNDMTPADKQTVLLAVDKMPKEPTFRRQLQGESITLLYSPNLQIKAIAEIAFIPSGKVSEEPPLLSSIISTQSDPLLAAASEAHAQTLSSSDVSANEQFMDMKIINRAGEILQKCQVLYEQASKIMSGVSPHPESDAIKELQEQLTNILLQLQAHDSELNENENHPNQSVAAIVSSTRNSIMQNNADISTNIRNFLDDIFLQFGKDTVADISNLSNAIQNWMKLTYHKNTFAPLLEGAPRLEVLASKLEALKQSWIEVFNLCSAMHPPDFNPLNKQHSTILQMLEFMTRENIQKYIDEQLQAYAQGPGQDLAFFRIARKCTDLNIHDLQVMFKIPRKSWEAYEEWLNKPFVADDPETMPKELVKDFTNALKQDRNVDGGEVYDEYKQDLKNLLDLLNKIKAANDSPLDQVD